MIGGYLLSGVLHATLVAALFFGLTGPVELPSAAGPAVTVELVTLAEAPEPPAPEPAETSPAPPRQAASPPPPRPVPTPEPAPEPEPQQQAQEPPPPPEPTPQTEPEPAPPPPQAASPPPEPEPPAPEPPAPRPEAVARPAPPAPRPEPVAPPEPRPAPEAEPAPELSQLAALPPEPARPAPRPALRPAPPPEPTPEPEPEPQAQPEPPRPPQPPPPPRPARAEPQPPEEPEPREDRLAALLRSVEENPRRLQDDAARPGEGRAPPSERAGEARALEGRTATMSAGEIDALKRQIEGCWTIPRAVPGIEDMVVRLRISLQADRRVRDVRIEDQARTAADPGYRAVAESAQRAVLTCSPLRVPPEKYQLWRELLLTFHLRDILGG